MAPACRNGRRPTAVRSSSSCASTAIHARKWTTPANDTCSSTACTPGPGRKGPGSMIVAPLLLLVPLAGHPVVVTSLFSYVDEMFQSQRDAGCTEWHDCRQLALAAADRGEYEVFHDLAWRTVQTGPPKDPALMYLLARAQALSGRPHDALVMLERLAEMGVPSDADTNDDFSRTRQLPAWPEVSARMARLSHPDP